MTDPQTDTETVTSDDVQTLSGAERGALEPVTFEFVRNGSVQEYHELSDPDAIRDMHAEVNRRASVGDLDGWWIKGEFDEWKASRQTAEEDGEENTVSTPDERGDSGQVEEASGQTVRREETQVVETGDQVQREGGALADPAQADRSNQPDQDSSDR